MDYVVSKVLIDLYKNIEEQEAFNNYREKLLDIIKKYMEKQNPVYTIIEQTNLKTSIITKTYYPRGIFKIYIEKNDIYATLEVLISLIITKNKGIFIVEDNMTLIDLLVKIGNKLINGNHFFINDDNSFFDVALCVGTKKYYNEILDFNYRDVIYIGYGESDIYLSDDFLDKKEKIKDNNVNIYYGISLNEAIVKMNELGSNFISSIFSKDEEEINHFLENCTSKNIYVNMLPSKKCYLDLDLNLFVKVKNVIISK